MPETDTPSTPAATSESSEPTTPPAPLLELRDPLPDVVDTGAALAEACAAIAAGTGPVSIDAERASGYRYGNRAYLIQLRREGSGTVLIDPIPHASLQPLVEALEGTEWILHAATQDLPCLTELGLRPTQLFDTELAGRLLGYPRVGLATLVETLLGKRLKKEHSAVDWSKRPLPRPWLEYAALDVEVLDELREVLQQQLVDAGKDDWARQEFETLRGFEQPERAEAWRRTSGTHRVRGRRGLAAVRALWETRDDIARTTDIAPGRILPDSAIVAAAAAQPRSRRELLETPGFHGRGAARYAKRWLAALEEAAVLDDDQLPSRSQASSGPPPPRAWPDKDPVAARRLSAARAALAEVSERHQVPAENLLAPDALRRALWRPPRTRQPGQLLDAVAEQLSELGARSWQIGLTAPALVDAIVGAEAEPDGESAPDQDAAAAD